MPNTKSIAIDPGYDRLGVAVFDGTELVYSECFVPAKGGLNDRLYAVFKKVDALIKKYKPTSLAIETLFFNKNQKTAIAVAEARGAIIVAATAHDVPVVEYSPQAVKIAVTGSGNAPKEAVIRMVEKLVTLDPSTSLRVPRRDDEYDAIALGIAHASRNPHMTPLRGK